MIKACIFDLDGVIVDTVEAHYHAWKKMADERGIPFDELANEQLKGVSRVDSMKRILAMGDQTATEEEILDLTQRKNDIYVSIISKMTPDDILPGVLRVLDDCQASGMKIAIGSSSKNTPTILKAVGLTDCFDTIVDGNQVSQSKPHPEVFLKGAQRLGLEPSECVVFEDAISGVAAAKAGGMPCIGVGEEKVLGDADLVVPDLKVIGIEEIKALAR